jgi:hypothetical protein
MIALLLFVGLLGSGAMAKIEPVVLNGTCALLSFNWMELKSGTAGGLMVLVY